MPDDFDATRTAMGGGAASAPASSNETFGGYRLLRLLGQGGVGSVYEAEELESSRIVALKFARDVAEDSPEREQLLHEARADAFQTEEIGRGLGIRASASLDCGCPAREYM